MGLLWAKLQKVWATASAARHYHHGKNPGSPAVGLDLLGSSQRDDGKTLREYLAEYLAERGGPVGSARIVSDCRAGAEISHHVSRAQIST